MNKDTRALIEKVANHLTGQPVTVRFEDPKTDIPANGATYKGTDGRPIVYISSEYFEDDEMLRVLTHELAHVVKHLGIMAPVNVDKPGAVFSSPSKHVDAPTARREAEAEALAEKWRRFAFLYRNIWSEESRLISGLKALLTYKEN